MEARLQALEQMFHARDDGHSKRTFLVDTYDQEEGVRRVEATDMKWNPRKETCEKYCRRKTIALRSVEANMDDRKVCQRLYDGLPAEAGSWFNESDKASPSIKKFIAEAQKIDAKASSSDLDASSQTSGRRTFETMLRSHLPGL